jgi:exodeoxyribonuclease V alpha subunit
VEAGSVLGDLCDSGHDHGYSAEHYRVLSQLGAAPQTQVEERGVALRDSLALLHKNYRFGTASGIGHLAQAINDNRADEALAGFKLARFPDISWVDTGSGQPMPGLIRQAVEHYQPYLRASSAPEALARFNQFRILGAVREGPYGVVSLNRAVEFELARRGFLDTRQSLYAGRPIMIIQNDYGLRLFNGDVGMLWADAQDPHRLRAFFALPDGTVRSYSPSRLPAHETVFAMTVHKSQGSEFDHVLLVLPAEASPVVTRELLYTGITRAMRTAIIASTEEMFRLSIQRTCERFSGLRQRLWEPKGSVPPRSV